MNYTYIRGIQKGKQILEKLLSKNADNAPLVQLMDKRTGLGMNTEKY